MANSIESRPRCRVATIAVVLPVLLLGCGPNQQGPACASDRDCPGAAVCTAQRCVAPPAPDFAPLHSFDAAETARDLGTADSPVYDFGAAVDLAALGDSFCLAQDALLVSPPDLASDSPCLRPAMNGQQGCIEPSGRLLIGLLGLRYKGAPIADQDVAQGKFGIYIWFDLTPPPGWNDWFVFLPLTLIAPAVAAAQVPPNLPSGLCPMTRGKQRHPFRLSAPQRVGATPDDVSQYVAMSGQVADYQKGLVAELPDQTGVIQPWLAMAIAKYPDPQVWAPAGAAARAEMDGPAINCLP